MSKNQPPPRKPALKRPISPIRTRRKSGASMALYSLRFRLVFVFLLLALIPSVLFVYILNWINQETWVELLLLTLFVVILILALAKVTHRLVVLPLSRMTKVVEKVAGGSLWEKAPEGKDDIGLLGATFNHMTSELRTTLHDLERRNAERASDLERVSREISYRATQLQTVTELARAIASVRDPDILLQQVTELISERFKFYHVAIFLLDRKAEYAILQAANSEGGKQMLKRGHRLKVGDEGIVGYVAQQGEPRVAHDVGEDAVYFDNPDLPYTRSELAIPFKAGEKVTGVLDVQSMEQSAFSMDDINLLSTLADQVAVAIENVRLYTETRKALAELENTHRQYLQERWTKLADKRSEKGYEYRYGKIRSISGIENSEGINGQVDKGDQVPISESPDISESSLVEDEIIVPITIRGQLIGSLELGKEQPSRRWSEDDLHLIQTVADQVGQALENSRLLEETQRRAEREHLVSEITTKLRASNDPQIILQTAMNELREALKTKRAHFVAQPGSPSSEDEIGAAGVSHRSGGDGA
jgi:GAF domain-containing protein/HAMP domain-containing protein